MTIKELIDSYGGVPAFRRMLKEKRNIYSHIPTRTTLYEHYRGKKPNKLYLKDIYEDLGVVMFRTEEKKHNFENKKSEHNIISKTMFSIGGEFKPKL